MCVDYPFRIQDEEALNILYDLIEFEGLFLGLSSGINIAGAKKLAKELGEGKTIVTILCDLANRYQNKMFNSSFLKEQIALMEFKITLIPYKTDTTWIEPTLIKIKNILTQENRPFHVSRCEFGTFLNLA